MKRFALSFVLVSASTAWATFFMVGSAGMVGSVVVGAASSSCSTDPNNPQLAPFSPITVRVGEKITQPIRVIDNDGVPGDANLLAITDLTGPFTIALSARVIPDPNKAYPVGSVDCVGNTLDPQNPTMVQVITVSPSAVQPPGTYKITFATTDGQLKSYWKCDVIVLKANKQPPTISN